MKNGAQKVHLTKHYNGFVLHYQIKMKFRISPRYLTYYFCEVNIENALKLQPSLENLYI